MIGSGRTSQVFLCESPRSKTRRALKKKSSDISTSLFARELSIISSLSHPNIIEAFPSSSISQPPTASTFQSDSIVMEYAQEGDLFEFAFAKRFEPKLARYYMIQLLNVLDYMHALNVYHRDLKLENLFLDDQFQLKVGDFGLAGTRHSSKQKPHAIPHNPLVSTSTAATPNSSIDDLTFHSSSSEGSETQPTIESVQFDDFVGTENYMAPELIKKRKYQGDQVDIFAFGVILFSLIHGFPPYPRLAHHSDPFYRLIIEKNFEKYWQVIEQKTGLKTDLQFKDFIFRLLENNPDKRITLEEIKKHPWMHGDIYNQREIVSSMASRKLIIKANQSKSNR